MGMLRQTDHIMMKGIMKMKRQTILPSSRATDVPFGNKSRTRAAVLAALFVTAIILGVIVFSPKEQENIDVELQSVATLAIGPVQLATPMPSSVHTPVPTSMPEVSESSAPSATPLQKKEGEGLFTLNILSDTISVAYGVEEATLKKTPGWLSTSALPGKEGMCVVYGHRNRNHLKVLEKVERGDTITVAMDGIVYTYTVSNITIYENTNDLRLPTVDGRTLVLVTCYPFRYSGHAPGKCVVFAKLLG